MNSESKEYSPYHGVLVHLAILILVPVGFVALLYVCLNCFQPRYGNLNWLTAKAIGCGAGALFHLSCAIVGVFTPGWRAVRYRIREFFENLVVSVGYAFESYWEDMKSDGVVFLLQMPIVAVNLYIAVTSLQEALPLISRYL